MDYSRIYALLFSVLAITLFSGYTFHSPYAAGLAFGISLFVAVVRTTKAQ